MKKLLFIFTVFLILLSHTIEAETYLQLHTISYHSNREIDFNESNYGVGVRHYMEEKSFDYATLGTYKNSEFNQSIYSGIGWEWPISNFKIGFSTGIITGYKSTPILPYIISNIRYKRLNLIISPFIEPVIHLTVDVLKF